MMKTVGQLLLWLGFLSGSLATVWRIDIKSEDAAEAWSTIPWTWYIVSAVACAIGALLLRMTKRSEGASTDQTLSGLGEINRSLSQLIENTKALKKTAGSIAPSRIAQQIDDTLADDFRVVGDGRDCVSAELGLQVFAEFMSRFAAGERAINRAWSASVDGYIDEAETCLDRGLEFLIQAQQQLGSASTGA